MRSYFVIVALLLSGACYSYRALDHIDTVTPEPGRRLEVQLTEAGAGRLESQLGRSPRLLDAELISADLVSLAVAVWQVVDAHHDRTQWRGERVTIPRDAIASVGERKLSAAGTGILGGLLAGSVFAAYEAFKGTGEVAGSGPTGGPGQGQQ